MLKTNSKKARDNIRAYIMANFDGCDYGLETPETFPETASTILRCFRTEKPAVGTYIRMSEQERFEDWAAGLPPILDTCYYYNRSAVDDLGQILAQTTEEKEKYEESAAENLLTRLIYRELLKGEAEHRKLNPICTDCNNLCNGCSGTTSPVWTGCVYRTTAETEEQKEIVERLHRTRKEC